MKDYKPSEFELASATVLLVGVTGGTGRQVVQGFLDGMEYSQIKPNLVVLTRSPQKPASKALEEMGCTLVQGDLDDPASLTKACAGVHAMYCHGTSADSANADPIEVDRAMRLAKACLQNNVGYVVYNSAGGVERDTGIRHIEQKGAIERIFRGAGLPSTMLRATLFMEELWKKYTRPSILKGTFRFALPPEKTQQYICCRDMGYAAFEVLADHTAEHFAGKDIELAGDELTCPQVAQEFSEVQQKAELPAVEYTEGSTWIFWLISRELYAIIMWYREKGYKANVPECRKLFPKLRTFREFLEATKWGDSELTYEDLETA